LTGKAGGNSGTLEEPGKLRKTEKAYGQVTKEGGEVSVKFVQIKRRTCRETEQQKRSGWGYLTAIRRRKKRKKALA